MKIRTPIVAMLALLAAATTPAADAVTAPRRPVARLDDRALPRTMTDAEKDWVRSNPDLRPRLASPPPTGPVSGASEYRPMEAILLGYSGTTAWKNILAEMARHITTTGNADVMVVVTSTSQRTDMTTRFTNAGANMSRVKSYIASLNSIWIRDYGPRFVYEGGVRVVVDSVYYSSRPQDDAIPSFMATQLGRPYYAMPLVHSGGNYHMGDDPEGYATRLALGDNPSMTETQIRDMFQAYYGLYTNLWTQLPWTVDGTGHVDMWFIPVSSDTIIISDWPSNAGSAQDLTCDSAAATMQQRGYNVIRVPARLLSNVHYTYINAVMCNNLVMIPGYTNTTVVNAGHNQAALAAWQQALPGKTIVQVNCEGIISAAGAIHCIVMHYPASTGGNNPVVHVRTPTGGDSLAPGQSVAVNWISDHVRTISAVDIELSIDGGQTFATVAANEANDGAYTWTVPDLYASQARIRVTARDAQGASGSDLNDAAFAITGTQPRDGDLDGNGLVDAGDIAVLLLGFGDCAVAADCLADLDRSGSVDAGDIGLMLLLFGSAT
jgi:agmatine deiminase